METPIVEPLSPELVLVSPPEVAALVRHALPVSFVSSAPAAQPPARRSYLRRAAGFAAFYVAAFAVTVTPLCLILQALPNGR